MANYNQDVEKRGSAEADTTERPSPNLIRWFLVCVAIFSANILYGLDTTAVADIQSAVLETFDNVAVGFTLGKAFAIFNSKWIFISCLANFTAASALCGAAPSTNALIAGGVCVEL
ncbi:hypothetical protein F4820DRAFT_444727 [Hypoxylon rubiginosum]|uniref:Uncharacterized protein n=1 Tax=Hypoxylon rubiginosum TaxID=110542 RepID=A0ACB9ZBP7_9PEZI|nr:hypothetical protein F4820DRAFT_444727 [Hypoxylon rubiginosum]